MHTKVIDMIFELKAGCSAHEDGIREKFHLSPAEFRCLIALAPKVIMSCNTLAKKMGLSVSRGSRVVEKMMRNGYLKEVKIEGDRRVVNITLSTKGIKIRDNIEGILEDCESRILKKISKTEIVTLGNILGRITDTLLDNK
jgi:DNA-binding MarR family transcriptional regulator